MAQYSELSRAQLSYDYLHTNSTTHEFLFGALAEILDNARDAKATKINVYTVPNEDLRGGFMLCFLDDGEGMDPADAADIITFGKSSKRAMDSTMIGMYGNGMKSGSMRIGNDLIVFTKKDAEMTCVFLSRSFHEEEQIEEIIVPMPTFNAKTKKPIASTAKDKEKHKLEMDLILKYSPFKTEAQFFQEFDKITESGTLVITYNLKLLDSGEPELDIKTSETDILLSNPESGEFDSDEGLMPERKSFRAYTSILYVDPRMRIYIQNKKVQTKRLASCLYKPKLYKYSSARFKTRAESECIKSKEEAKIADNRAKEAESKARNLENKQSSGGIREQRAELRKAQTNAVELRKEAQLRKQIADRKTRSLREPKTLNFIFGVNLENRGQDGMFVYNCSRLIKMYQKVGPQADGGVFCSGVVGIVDVPYLVLEPTHNKQDFADAKEYRHLQRAMGEHMVQYWKDLGIASQGVTKFWENFGYVSPNWRDPPSQENKYSRKRSMQIQITLQCDVCLKWRMIPFSANNIGKTFPDEWVCSMNPEPSHNRCSNAEQKPNIPEGVFKKEVKSREEKAKDLEDEIRKKQEALDKISKTKAVTSSRQAKQMIEESSEEEEEEEEEERPAAKSRRSSTASSTTSAAKSPAAARSPARGSAKKRAQPSRATVIPEESESEEEEVEEESEEEFQPPVKRGRQAAPAPKPPPAKKPAPVKVYQRPAPKPEPKAAPKSRAPPARKSSPPPSPAKPQPARGRRGGKAQSSSEEEEEDEVEEMPEIVIEKKEPPTPTTTVRSRGRVPPRVPETKLEENGKDEPMDVKDNDVGTSSDVEVEEGESQLGVKVEAKLNSKWFTGVVVEVNKRQKKWKIKFDKQPQDKNDKWFDQTSTDVRLYKQSPATQQSAAESSTVDKSAADQVAETPSSSTSQHQEDITNGYRTCLRYFLPPNWIMDKEAVSTLTIEELANFSLDDFFDHYEKGLRKLVSSFQIEAQSRQQEADAAKTKLSSIRKMIAKLLKSINEEFEIDPECDTDQVDELLALCVKQAVQQAEEK